MTTTHKTKPTTQACAACRYQRRKCTPNCLFKPYFPRTTTHHRQFQNAHKLFGVSNITKIIKNLDHHQRDDAMQSIIYQSDARAQHPVEGCCKIIRQLHHQIETASNELQIVLKQLALCRTLGVQKYYNNPNDYYSFNNNSASFDCDQVDFDEFGYDFTKDEASEGNVYDEENEKDVMKVENVYYNEEEEYYDDDDDDDDDVKDFVNFGTFQDGKAI